MLTAAPLTDAGQSSRVLVRGAGGALTADAVSAYLDALEFCLRQVGRPATFDAATRGAMTTRIVQGYSGYPELFQRELAQSRATWDHHRKNWSQLSAEQQVQYAYFIIAAAYGEQAAAEALGLGGGAGGGSYAGEVNRSVNGSAVSGNLNGQRCTFVSAGGTTMKSCN
jgi:hypothetical protein